MKRFLACLLLLLGFSAEAAHVAFTNSDFTTAAQSVRKLDLYPVGAPFTNGGVIVTRDRVSRVNNTNGWVIVSNIIGGTYRGEFQGTFTTSTNHFLFPVTNGIINAADWVVSPTNWPGGVGYTMAVADGRFIQSSAGSGTNNTFRGTITMPGSGVSGYVWTATNNAGAGYWRAAIAGTNINLAKGQLLRVDPVNGNNSTGTRGDDALPFLTIQAAMAASQAGDTVVPNGYFTTASQIQVSNNVHLIGDFILNTSYTNATRAALVPGDNSVIKFTRLICTNNEFVGGVGQTPVGYPVGAGSADSVFTNAHVWGTIEGDSDGIYYNRGGCVMYYWGPQIISRFDAVAIYGNSTLFIENTIIDVIAGAWTTAQAGMNGLRSDDGKIFAKNCTINVTGSTKWNKGIVAAFGRSASSTTAFIRAEDCILNVYGSAQTNADLMIGCSYDDLGPESTRPLQAINVTRTNGLPLRVHGWPVAANAQGWERLVLGTLTADNFYSANAISVRSNKYPMGSFPAPFSSWSELGPSGIVLWNSNGIFYAVSTNSLTGIASTNIVYDWVAVTNIAGVTNIVETAIKGQTGTNLIYIAGAGTAAANGLYTYKGQAGSIHIYTNANGQTGIPYDHSLSTYGNEYNITNTSAALLYDGAEPGQGTLPTSWAVQTGAGPAPTSVRGTNFYTNSFPAYYAIAGTAPASVAMPTNILFVNNQSPYASDTNAVRGNMDRPWLTVSNALSDARSNEVVYVFPGFYPEPGGITIQNNVKLQGFHRDLVRIGGVEGTDPVVTMRTNSSLENVNGYFEIQSIAKNIRVQNVNATGQVDCIIFSLSCSNFMLLDSIIAARTNSSTSGGGQLIDAAVISLYRTNTGFIRNTFFVSDRIEVVGTGNTRRGLAHKGGLITMQGGGFSVRNAENGYGWTAENTLDTGTLRLQDVLYFLESTNYFQAAGSNFAGGVATTVVLNGAPGATIDKFYGTIQYTNSFPASNLFGRIISQNIMSTTALYVDTAKMTDVGDGRVAFETGIQTPSITATKYTNNGVTASTIAAYDVNKQLTNAVLTGLAFSSGTLITNFSAALLPAQNNFSASNFFATDVAVSGNWNLKGHRRGHVTRIDAANTSSTQMGDVIADSGTATGQVPTATEGYTRDSASDGTGNSKYGWASTVLQYRMGRNIYMAASVKSQNETLAGVFIGLTDQTLSTQMGSTNPAGNWIGFLMPSNSAAIPMRIATKDNTTQSFQALSTNNNTAIHLYEIIINDTAGTAIMKMDGAQVGTTFTQNLPLAGTNLRFCIGGVAANGATKNLRFEFIEVQSDR